MTDKRKVQKSTKGNVPADCGGIKPAKLLTPKDKNKSVKNK
jgi:hypothetical protein